MGVWCCHLAIPDTQLGPTCCRTHSVVSAEVSSVANSFLAPLGAMSSLHHERQKNKQERAAAWEWSKPLALAASHTSLRRPRGREAHGSCCHPLHLPSQLCRSSPPTGLSSESCVDSKGLSPKIELSFLILAFHTFHPESFCSG